MLDGLLSMTLGQHEKAVQQLRAAVDRDPFFNYANFNLGNALYLQGRYGEAEAIFRRMEPSASQLDYLPVVLLANGRRPDAEAALQTLIAQHGATDASCIAMTYAYRNEKQLALQWLERAYAQGDAGLMEMVGGPLLKNISAEPRFHALLRAMNLTD
jgi:tetratricopeptide (TPR) repeat protein